MERNKRLLDKFASEIITEQSRKEYETWYARFLEFAQDQEFTEASLRVCYAKHKKRFFAYSSFVARR